MSKTILFVASGNSDAGLMGIDLSIWGTDLWRRARPESGARSRYRGRELTTGLEYSKAHCAAKVALNPIDPTKIASAAYAHVVERGHTYRDPAKALLAQIGGET